MFQGCDGARESGGGAAIAPLGCVPAMNASVIASGAADGVPSVLSTCAKTILPGGVNCGLLSRPRAAVDDAADSRIHDNIVTPWGRPDRLGSKHGKENG